MGRLVARVVFRSDWPLRMILWKQAHHVANRLAWRFARPPGPEWGVALRIDRSHPLWRINNWLGDQWSGWWVQRSLDRDG